MQRPAPLVSSCFFLWLVSSGVGAQSQCPAEPWGRYSASGLLLDGVIYTVGGDTWSHADRRGGVVRTAWRYSLESSCWVELPQAPVQVGYRGSAVYTGNGTALVFAGSTTETGSRVPNAQLWRWSLPSGTLVQVPQTGAWPAARWKPAAVQTPLGMLVTGGRGPGTLVHGDAWLWTGAQWRNLGTCVPEGIYRHGMTWLPSSGQALLFGGIDGTLTRHSRMYSLQLSGNGDGVQCDEIRRPEGAPWPGPRASHGVQELEGSVYVWGGTCSDTAVWRWENNSWCTLPNPGTLAPTRRDAFVWGTSPGTIWMAQGDIICLEVGKVYPIADVWRLNVASGEWNLQYSPYNSRSRELAWCTGQAGEATGCRPHEGEVNIAPNEDRDLPVHCAGTGLRDANSAFLRAGLWGTAIVLLRLLL